MTKSTKIKSDITRKEHAEWQYYPGTRIIKTEADGRRFIDGLFAAGGGLVMSQIRALTGVASPTVQNWAARGFMPRPVGKQYTEDQTARILIINALRDVLELEKIKKLLIYVNGSPEDVSDDIISERELYGYICETVAAPEFSAKNIDALIDSVTLKYEERIAGAKKRLTNALRIICTAYLSGELKSRSERMLDKIQSDNIFGEQIGG